MRASKVLPETDTAFDTITLDAHDRFRRRIRMTSDNGTEFLLDLPDAVFLQNGNGLVLDDGNVIVVKAAEQNLLEIRGNDPHHLTTLAWHLGNRHLATEVGDGWIRILDDRIIRDMVIGLGGKVTECTAPFNPVVGAYASHSHDH